MAKTIFLQQDAKRGRFRHTWQVGLLLSIATAACGQAATKTAPTSALPFTVHEVAKFSSPWAMAFVPGTNLALVTEKDGALWLADLTTGARQRVGGVPAVKAGGQGGLLDVAISPTFAADRRIYLTYSEPSAIGGSSLALARATLVQGASARLDQARVVWRDPAGGKGGQFGAIVVFAPDGKSLFLSSGERQRFTPAQDASQPLGKILRLTLDGQPAPGNPAAGQSGAASVTLTDPPANSGAATKATGRAFAWPGANRTPSETFSSGHRNPYGLAFDAAGRLWETEMGPQGGDELNLILPGRNYGWPNASNGSNYDDSDIPDHKPGDGYEAPKAFWNPSISPGGLIIYSGSKFPRWRGDALIPALSGEALIRIDLDGVRATKAEQWPMGARLRSVAQGPDGSVYLLEDEGRLLRLDPAK